jgi:AraC-like DNA-binding protein
MRFVSREPCAALSPFVRVLWYFEGRALTHQRERKLPQTEMQLLVNLHEDELRWWDGRALAHEHHISGTGVCGIYSGPFALDTAGQRRVVGAVVRPGAAPALFGVAADALCSQHVALDALWGSSGRSLRERLLEVDEPAHMLQMLDVMLTDRLAGRLAPSQSIAFACGALDMGRSVAAISDELGWSGKRLRERFTAAIGVTPKRYARLSRLQRLLTSVGAKRTQSWAELALAHGYYDQAHLISEFRTLTGLAPSEYAPRDGTDQNHVVLRT